jgi:hypothetical protein
LIVFESLVVFRQDKSSTMQTWHTRTYSYKLKCFWKFVQKCFKQKSEQTGLYTGIVHTLSWTLASIAEWHVQGHLWSQPGQSFSHICRHGGQLPKWQRWGSWLGWWQVGGILDKGEIVWSARMFNPLAPRRPPARNFDKFWYYNRVSRCQTISSVEKFWKFPKNFKGL